MTVTSILQHAITPSDHSRALAILLFSEMESFVQVRNCLKLNLIFLTNFTLVPCATFHESYPTFNDGGESFPTGTFEVSNLATIETGSQQDGVTNWKPSSSWTDKISYVQLEPKCKLEAFNQNDFTKLIGSWRGSQNLQNGHEMLEGKENDKISSYTCSCSEESCDSYYMFGKDVPKGCQSPKCDVVTYSLTDSWRKKVI